MSLQYIRDCYGVPAKRGGKILYRGYDPKSAPIKGVIVGSRNSYLKVRMEGIPQLASLHSTWMVEYLP